MPLSLRHRVLIKECTNTVLNRWGKSQKIGGRSWNIQCRIQSAFDQHFSISIIVLTMLFIWGSRTS